MIISILSSPWTLVFVLIFGPLLLWWIRKRAKEREAGAGKGGARPAAATS